MQSENGTQEGQIVFGTLVKNAQKRESTASRTKLENLLQCSVNSETLKVFSRFIVERYNMELFVHFHVGIGL